MTDVRDLLELAWICRQRADATDNPAVAFECDMRVHEYLEQARKLDPSLTEDDLLPVTVH